MNERGKPEGEVYAHFSESVRTNHQDRINSIQFGSPFRVGARPKTDLSFVQARIGVFGSCYGGIDHSSEG